MIGQPSGRLLVVPLAVGLLMVLATAYGAWKSARRKDLPEALKAAGGLLAGSWFVCCGLGVVPKALFLPLTGCAFGTSLLLMIGGHFLVNRPEALFQLGRSTLGAALMVIGILGLQALGVTGGPLFYAGLLVIVFLTAVVISLLRQR